MRAVVYGARADGHARVVIELLAGGHELVGLLEDGEQRAGRRVGALEVIGDSNALHWLAADGVEGVLLGFGAARGRTAIVAAIQRSGLALPVLVHPRAFVAASAELGPGCQVLPGASVGPGAVLGAGVLVNTGAIVEHDAQVGAGAVIGPRATLAGRVTVGSEAELGAGAVAIPDVRIGPRAIVGAGAVVIGDVPADATVVGVPARQITG